MSADPAQLERVLGAASFAAAAGASAAQMADLERFRALLGDWNQRMNLVSDASLADFWSRHAWDSAQLLRVEPRARIWADIGAGAGFPGLVLAILKKGEPGAEVHLIESQAKRCRFLAAVVEALDLSAHVHNTRAEDLALKVEIATARAVAPLARLLAFAKPMLDKGALGLFLKGREAAAEVAEAHKTWRFQLESLPSLSDPDARILKVWGLARGR
jgi:16S rRNA (guanine527-N7)-methyltransferase